MTSKFIPGKLYKVLVQTDFWLDSYLHEHPNSTPRLVKQYPGNIIMLVHFEQAVSVRQELYDVLVFLDGDRSIHIEQLSKDNEWLSKRFEGPLV